MVTFRRFILASVATLLIAGACTSIPTIPTIPPLGGVPGFTIPPIVGVPGVSIPAGTTPCQIVTAAEVSQIFGTQVTEQSDSSTDCSFLLSISSVVTVTTSNDTDFSSASILLGQTAVQSTIGGFPAVSGVFIGQPEVYVQKGGTQLQVLGVLTGSDATTMSRLQQVATIGVGRLP